MFNIINDDCLNGMKTFSDNYFHSSITDPPYGLNFMGAGWDHGVPGKEYWQEVYRVLKSGGHLLSFGGTRMFHRLMVEIEDAGFEIRDTIMWIYGSGFPKGLNIGKSTGLTEFQGWNTNLKPAWEPIIIARKPVETTIAENAIKHGTGGINIDGCRVNRYPANLIHDGSEEVLEHFPNSKSTIKRNAVGARNDGKSIYGKFNTMKSYVGGYEDSGSAARFFYCAKASPTDRNEGCEDIEPQKTDNCRKDGSPTLVHRPTTKHGNHHPTVKPTSLMQYLCRLVTPKNGIILDPFMGSGSTGKAAILEGFNFVGIEKEADYANIARKRCEYAKNRTDIPTDK
jgi:site-specific DNA-methyltransferase (adenine-specific)